MLLYEHWPEGRKRTLLIAAAVIAARHLKSDKELIGEPNSNLLQLLKGATRIASLIMKKVDSGYSAH
jgi:hypothetical protein